VKAFLADLRAKRQAAPTVVVELRWLWLDAAQYDLLLGSAKPSGNGQSPLAIDAKALDLLALKPRASAGGSPAPTGNWSTWLPATGDRSS